MHHADKTNDDFNEILYLFSENITAQRSPESSISSDESMDTVILSKENVPQAMKTNDSDSTDSDTEESDTIVHGKQDCSTVNSITSYDISEEEYTGSLSILIVSHILSEILRNISDEDEYECTANDMSDDDSEDGISTDEGIVATDSDEEDWINMTYKKHEAIYVDKPKDIKVTCD